MGGGSRTVGDDWGKNTTGLMGETGEGACLGLLRELGGLEFWSGLVGDVPPVNTARGSGGVGVSRDTQGAAGWRVILGWDGEPAGATPPGGEEEAAADAAAGWCSLVGDFAGEAAWTDGTTRPDDSICGPRRVVRWRACLSRAVPCQSYERNSQNNDHLSSGISSRLK